ncbi:hypothetical protein C7M84_021165 [Penaeus vannamei]|uniref:Uncharacterized protein n=1 Tax=Penaeus vannamei TaxID=6689 RepID=A0A3R7Q9V3_PENVA|nr:hypothetical protein C7M84_021165 [Penaeus vannamei]
MFLTRRLDLFPVPVAGGSICVPVSLTGDRLCPCSVRRTRFGSLFPSGGTRIWALSLGGDSIEVPVPLQETRLVSLSLTGDSFGSLFPYRRTLIWFPVPLQEDAICAPVPLQAGSIDVPVPCRRTRLCVSPVPLQEGLDLCPCPLQARTRLTSFPYRGSIDVPVPSEDSMVFPVPYRRTRLTSNPGGPAVLKEESRFVVPVPSGDCVDVPVPCRRTRFVSNVVPLELRRTRFGSLFLTEDCDLGPVLLQEDSIWVPVLQEDSIWVLFPYRRTRLGPFLLLETRSSLTGGNRREVPDLTGGLDLGPCSLNEDSYRRMRFGSLFLTGERRSWRRTRFGSCSLTGGLDLGPCSLTGGLDLGPCSLQEDCRVPVPLEDSEGDSICVPGGLIPCSLQETRFGSCSLTRNSTEVLTFTGGLDLGPFLTGGLDLVPVPLRRTRFCVPVPYRRTRFGVPVPYRRTRFLVLSLQEDSMEVPVPLQEDSIWVPVPLQEDSIEVPLQDEESLPYRRTRLVRSLRRTRLTSLFPYRNSIGVLFLTGGLDWVPCSFQEDSIWVLCSLPGGLDLGPCSLTGRTSICVPVPLQRTRIWVCSLTEIDLTRGPCSLRGLDLRSLFLQEDSIEVPVSLTGGIFEPCS